MSQQLYNSPVFDNKLFFGKYYFPHYFRKSSPAFHLQIVNTCSENLYVAIKAPRGSAKSTVTTFLDTMHGICLKKERFIVIVQNTYAKAAGSLNNIKYEFRYNEKLRQDFGVTMEVKDAEGDTIFSHSDGFMCRVLCKGADQLGSIRGERFGAYRPTLIIVDDIEDDEMVKNPERRDELEKQFNEVLNYAGEAGETRIIVDGTILHDDSLLAKMIDPSRYLRFKKLRFKARENGVSLWPEKWSMEDLEEMENDNPEAFAKEMQGDPSSGSLETIRRDDFRYWRMEDGQAVLYGGDSEVVARWSLRECKVGVGIDLAWEEKKASDFSAIVPGFVTPANDILVDDYIMKKGMRPDELEHILFDMDLRYDKMTGHRVCFGFEKAKLEKVMKWFLREAMKRRGKFLWFKDVEWGTRDKIERIMFRIANRYSQHSIYHKKGMGILENQLVRLRSATHDDGADALAMLPEMLSGTMPLKKKKTDEDEFNWWRSRAIARKRGLQSEEAKKGVINEHANPHTSSPTGMPLVKTVKKGYVFGSKGIKRPSRVPCQIAYR